MYNQISFDLGVNFEITVKTMNTSLHPTFPFLKFFYFLPF